jgi:Epoxide hydrolase N terminus
MTQPIATQQGSEQAADKTAIRPFRVNVPEADFADLRRRLAATRWPDKETVADQSQGVQLAKLQELVRYWGTDYDWRKAEAKLNTFPQFKTTIDGLDIHFIHVRSRHPNALPLIITHGWPGSIFEQIKLIGPLDNFTLYWLTNTAASSARIYWENRGRDLISAAAQKTDEISVPVAITVFPDEVFRAQERWARGAFRNLIYFRDADRGGHFAMWEHPELFAAELRAAFKSLR